jgi:SAM-dependent methyltransferase
VTDPVYDRIGRTYAATRRPDPRIQAQIWAALAGARTVVNVGAGAGSYEPPETILAVEPSAAMIAQRPPGSAPAVQASAERIPLPDGACDAALASLTIHHWSDQAAGFGEMRRVARRLVIFTWDPDYADRFWLVRDYLPESIALDQARMPPIDRVRDWMGGAEVRTVPVPHDCEDGFFCAYWRRPAAYLDPLVRAGASNLAQLGTAVDRAVAELGDDLRSGRWCERNAELLELDEIDLGYRLLVSRSQLTDHPELRDDDASTT